MKVEKVSEGRYRMEMSESELRSVQFVTGFFLSLRNSVFTGHFPKRVERIHDTLERVK